MALNFLNNGMYWGDIIPVINSLINQVNNFSTAIGGSLVDGHIDYNSLANRPDSSDGNTLNLGRPAFGYYSLDTAIAAVPAAKRKPGLCITFMSALGVWQLKQFTADNISLWSDPDNWSDTTAGISAVSLVLLNPGDSPTASLSGTTLTLGIPSPADGSNAVNPCKGFSTDIAALPSSDKYADGDYIFAPTDEQDSSAITIWYWDAAANGGAGAFVNSGKPIDPAALSMFANSSKPIAQTNVVDNLHSSSTEDVLSANQGNLLGNAIYGTDQESLGSAYDISSNKAYYWKTGGNNYSLDDAVSTIPSVSPNGYSRTSATINKGQTYEMSAPAGVSALSFICVVADGYIRVYRKGLNSTFNTSRQRVRVSLDNNGALSVSGDMAYVDISDLVATERYDSVRLYVNFSTYYDLETDYLKQVIVTHSDGIIDHVEHINDRLNCLDETVDNVQDLLNDTEGSSATAAESSPHPLSDCSLAAKVLREGGRDYYLGTDPVISDGDYSRSIGDGDSYKSSVGYLDSIISSLPKGRHFMVFADSHLDYPWEDSNGYNRDDFGLHQKQHEVMRYCYEALGGCKVIFLGDFIGQDFSKERILREYDYFARKNYGLFGGDFIFVIGGHEPEVRHPQAVGGNYPVVDVIEEDVIYNKLFAPAKKYGAVFDSKAMAAIDSIQDWSEETKKYWKALAGMSFYKDDDRLKARIISISSDVGVAYSIPASIREQYDGREYATPKAYQGMAAAICNVHFVCKALEDMPEDYIAIICFHTESGNPSDGVYSNLQYSGFWRIFQAANAFKAKTQYTLGKPSTGSAGVPDTTVDTIWQAISQQYDTKTFDFSAKSGKVFMMKGHIHYDGAWLVDVTTSTRKRKSYYNYPDTLTVADNAVLMVSVDRCALNNGSSNDQSSYYSTWKYRKASKQSADNYILGTTREVLFDIVTITDDDLVIFTRVGNYPLCGSADVCDNFDSTKAYVIDDEVIYFNSSDSQLHKYKFIANHQGEWDYTDVVLADDATSYVRTYDLNKKTNG